MLVCQLIELQPSQRQEKAFHSHAAAARIARNDLIALWREEGGRLPGFRLKTGQLRPELNRAKEEGLAPDFIGGLQGLGYRLEIIQGHARVVMGGGQVIQRNPETGVLWAGSEPRKDGCAVGF